MKPAAVRSSLEDPWATHTVNPEVRETVRKVLTEIQEEGDVAVARYAEMYEGNVRPDNNFKLSEKEIEHALSQTPKTIRDDILESQNNVRRFAQE